MLQLYRPFTTLLFCILCLQAYASNTQIPQIDAADSAFHGRLSLSGTWALVRNDWPTLKDIQRGTFTTENIEIPGFLHAGTGEQSHGHNTFLVRISNLNQTFVSPAVNIYELREAWRAWWIDDSGEYSFLGESGKISKTPADQQQQTQPYLLEFPSDSASGTLVIYQSSHHLFSTGITSELTVTEKDDALRAILTDLAARFLFFGVGLFVIIQNLVFFAQRRKETVLLILAAFAFITLARSALSSGYVDYFINQPGFFFYSIRLEYILIIFPGIMALQLILTVFPIAQSKPMLYASYLLLGMTILLTSQMSVTQMTQYLPVYQAAIFVIGLTCIALICRGLLHKADGARSFLLAFTPIMIAVANDIIANRSPHYSFYCADYAIFIFLFLQSQIQASRFVSALDTAEHLTENLHEEVRIKTEELSRQNSLLTEKTQDLEKQHSQIKLLSETDHLTGLYNRQTLESHAKLMIQLAFTYNQPLSLVMMDLDNFKQINDRFGHMVGDECLIFTASYLRGYKLRKRDILARFGGEELVIILNDTSLEVAREITQALCEGLASQPVTGDHPDIHLTASFGIAELHSSRSSNLKDLFRCADLALYRAKQNGRNRVESYRANRPAIKL
ncbi:sensor domain-containing diguanylate cyclase [Reinekea marinisedimentorum]|uniref:diguanylate cyclase n=1 Tax=Reinekea marinisedimentorum TaxID=230495 RepID=A0A4R3I7J1_9GAMM|nr:diguanylate cyclase [Reinekea marinisedimentorum]TCS40091.1 diguanylate cyclase (GGDEF)-like protein [Reinekea marinisedimentorum]